MSNVTIIDRAFKGDNQLREIIFPNIIMHLVHMSEVFSGCSALTSIDLSSFDTTNVPNMGYLFYGCSSLTILNLSMFNTSSLITTNCMFNNTGLSTIYVDPNIWDMSAVTNSTDMFTDSTSLLGERGTSYSSSNPQDKTYAHIDGGVGNPGYFWGPVIDGYLNSN